MKTVFRHPPEDLTGKRYWRSLEELADTQQFRSWLQREFPAGAAEIEMDGVSRRNFLRLMGAEEFQCSARKFRINEGVLQRDDQAVASEWR